VISKVGRKFIRKFLDDCIHIGKIREFLFEIYKIIQEKIKFKDLI